MGVCLVIFTWVVNKKAHPRQEKVVTTSGNGTALIGGAFRLKDTQGKTRTEKDFKNVYLLVYFGYSYCPDICPTALSNISEAMKLLGYKRGAVQPLFISVDPERDNPALLKTYMENFDPKFVALSGEVSDVEAAKRAYKVYSNKVNPETSGTTDYLIDHTSIVYLMAPDGSFVTHFNHETSPHEMARVIKEMIP